MNNQGSHFEANHHLRYHQISDAKMLLAAHLGRVAMNGITARREFTYKLPVN